MSDNEDDHDDDNKSDGSDDNSDTLARSAAALAAQGRRNWDESFQALVTYKKRYGAADRLIVVLRRLHFV